ncbi:CAP domain-containing protein [Streptomyces wedmorensis]|uniref:CAP domain-containing protein n=1 Tax=Streptomyces wedmorensis TaxID=43759 RepID=UPI0037BB7A75
MQQTMGFEQLTDAELIRAAQWGAPWVRQHLVAVYQPLVHALAARALDGRADADEVVRSVVQDTLGRAEFTLGTLPQVEAVRPWFVSVAVASTLSHAAGVRAQPAARAGSGGDPAGVLLWLDVEDALMAALWSLEQDGWLSRYETAAALSWSAHDTAMRMEAVGVRMDRARSVTVALAREPRCPALARQVSAWDGRPGAAWREELAGHTVQCAHCATGIVAAGPSRATATAATTVTAAAASGGMTAAATEHAAFDTFDTFDDPDASGAFDATETYLVRPHPADPSAPAGHVSTAAAVGSRSSRAARRRRRQADERTRRRATVAAGIAVAAVTAGAFSLQSRDGEDRLEANRAAAPGLDLPLGNDPGTLTASPSTAAASPSASASATAKPSGAPTKATATPTKSPRPTTATPAPKRPTTPAATTAAPTRSATPTGGTDTGTGGGSQQDTGQKSTADQVIALVNAERAKAGCGPLSANAALTRAAQGHSDDMAARDFFDHTNPDGDGPGQRVTAAGYPWSTYGENIAMGQKTPEQVMEAWMNSPGHRANILNCDFKEIGIGIHSSGGPYWTQVFGAR